MITLTITADTPADLKEQLAALLSGTAPVAPEAAAPAAEKPKTTTRKAAEPKAEPKAEVEQAPAEEQADTTDKPLDFNTDVAPVVVATVEKYGKPVVVEVFAQFGVAKASEVPEAQWGELITALNDAAAAAKPLA